MDKKQPFSDDGDAQNGIELAPTTKPGHYSQPGLEVVDYSNLEVVSPRPGLSHTRTWEKNSNLPQVAAPYGQHPALTRGMSRSEMGTPHTPYSGGSYEFMDPHGHHGNGGFVAGGGSGGPPVKDGIFRQDTICGVKRQMFWIIMAIGIFVMVAAVAIGVGLGVALHKDGDPTPSSTPLPSANSTASPTVLPPPTATGATGPEVAIRCPANNLTLYGATGTDKSYLLLCGRDYSSLDGAVDLFSEPMDTMSDCIDECARQQGCVGVGYGPYNNKQQCWLKSKLGDPNVTPNWYFAVEDSGAAKATST